MPNNRIGICLPAVSACLVLLLISGLLLPSSVSAGENNKEIAASFTAVTTSVTTPEILDLYTDLFRVTYRSAPEIRVARDRVEEKKALRYTAWAKRLAPNVSGRLSQVHAFNQDPDLATTEDQNPDSGVYTDGDDYQDWGLTLDLPLYRRPVSLQVDIAERDLKLAQNTLTIKTQELDLRLRDLLGKYLIASYQLLNLKNSVRISREHVQKIQQGYELRDQTRLQLLRAQANLKELEAREDLNVQQKESALRELLDYTGLNQTDPVFQRLEGLLQDEAQTAGCINSLADLENAYKVIRPYVEEKDPEWLRRFFMNHSLLREQVRLERDLAASQALLNTQYEWPGLSLRGLYDRKPDSRFEDFEGEGSLAIVLSVPLFSGGTIFSNTTARSAATRVADTTHYLKLRKNIHDMENSRQLIISLRKVYATQKVHLEQQREIVILSLESYAIKQTSMQDLLTSKNRLIDAKNALMTTTNTLGTAYRQFAWQLGIPYPTPKIPLPTTGNTVSPGQ